MQLHFLITSKQRAYGAMFMESLDETVLAFMYPSDGTRTFLTLLLPADEDRGLERRQDRVEFDEVILCGWVRLPTCRYVIRNGA